ncbi:parallel beta helix pectate lyase-like protein [Diaminobutyricimonas aerilata]|uniref:Parallel beta helix pectate lyase-like protein n=1 Tax=Diaminobutyricimonas aerilata TaxID=1162967 RepID=A0A2M9CMX7_9MICO|nr:right-handed parallel beta-helix repeat-containing protein [Diaminobutyricimonas aerilata]PJJ73228.1 parallel beta helix pectate lyase-like protein [Diaminobutyricimonas aerilata]
MRSVLLLAASALLLTLGACSTTGGPSEPEGDAPAVVTVPTDAPTITEAVDRVAEGGLVLVEPGTYTETVVIDTEGVTLRGLDRNEVVIDGEGLRPEGVVVIADGVRVENLTVKEHTFNGVLVTGMHDGGEAQAHGLDGYETLDPEKFPPIERFSISHVTSYNNGLYGIYAFDSRHGSITDSYASGSADSGFYVGQCEECDIVVRGNTAENNAVGFENANASDSVYIVGNRWSGNRIGMTLLSNYQEAFLPQRANTVVGNLIADNVSSQSPAQADGGFGVGLGIAGGQSNVLERNTIAGNPHAGVLVSGAEDIAAQGNRFSGTVFADNGVDLANTSLSRAAASGNCLAAGDPATTAPASFARDDCDAAEQAAVATDALTRPEAPPGMSFLKVPAPPAQPQLPGDLRSTPDPLPDTVGAPDDLASVLAPARDWRPGA